MLLSKLLKYIFAVIIETVANRKDASLDKSMINHPRHVTLTSLIFQIVTSGRYHRDMKIVRILAYNSKQFRVYGIFKK